MIQKIFINYEELKSDKGPKKYKKIKYMLT